MSHVAFYCMNKKGYTVLERFIAEFGSDAVAFIVTAQDSALDDDCFDEIVALAGEHRIPLARRGREHETGSEKFTGYRFVIGWRWMIRDTDNLIIFHDSLLPKYRGFAPLVNALINGEKNIGVTALQAGDEYDCGDIIAQESMQVSYPVTILDAIDAVSALYSELVHRLYTMIRSGEPLPARQQDQAEASYSPWLDAEDYRVDWNWPADRIRRFVDAVGSPYACASSVAGTVAVKLRRVVEADERTVEDRQRHIGKVIAFEDGRPVVICGEGMLAIVEMVDEDGHETEVGIRTRFG